MGFAVWVADLFWQGVAFFDTTKLQTIAASVSAMASVVLGYLTWVLARETRILSRATSQAHVTVTLEPNLWAMRWIDIIVENSGNAVAHDIDIIFTPPLPAPPERRKTPEAPLQRVSILRPSQSIKSNLCEYGKFENKTFTVSISWKSHPSDRKREKLEYSLSLADYEGLARLGASDPLIQLAEQVKNLREDWKSVASGGRKIRTDVYNQADRDAEQEALNEIYKDLIKKEPTQSTD